MKKILYFLAAILTVLGASSFTDTDESSGGITVYCDQSSSAVCTYTISPKGGIPYTAYSTGKLRGHQN